MYGKYCLILILQTLTVGSITTVFTRPRNDSGSHIFNNDVSISMSIRAKLNGTSMKTNNVVKNSHVTLHCKVSFNKKQQYLFNLMLVSITFPNGENVVPGSCTVDMEKAFKRCKIVIKRVSAGDQGTYRCHAQYVSGNEIIENYDDIILRVRKYLGPVSTIPPFEKKRVIVTSIQHVDPNPTHRPELRNHSLSQVTHYKTKSTLLSTGYVLTITGMVLISICIVVVILLIKRKRCGLVKKINAHADV
ncbi:uncharacterized protein LOC114534754 isoform X1 [Dendronephthya gigantea]|uniref:uncharacterized protein LOC114534754 isoform X1 n=1 Tax=Dendronephthya gigantea TaxID=151771 RepID=UPI001069C0C4|nr:uncharacterized protein LOC114534754 isoform X1 [Dendronephthya gigantea]